LTNNQFLEVEKYGSSVIQKKGYSGVLTGVTSLSKNEKRCIFQINPSAPQLNALFKIPEYPHQSCCCYTHAPKHKLVKNKSSEYKHNVINSNV